MLNTKHSSRYFVCVLALLFYSLNCIAFSKPKASKGIKFTIGPVVSLYSINKNHAAQANQKASFIAGVKKEWRLDKEHRSFFISGVDYFFHGLNFRSYYFKPDTLKIYDKYFAYDYSLYIHELHLPFQFKYLFKRKDNRLYNSYLQLGYHLRYLLTSDLKVTLNGEKVKYDSPAMSFKSPLISKRVNPFVSVSYGWQKNSIGSIKGNLFVEVNLKYGFSPYSFDKPYAASSLYINSSHLTFLVGFKL
jgi:hypothetical protein